MKLQFFRMNNLSAHFYNFCSFFFQLTNGFVNVTAFCTPSYPINIIMPEKILKVMNSAKSIYLLNFG